MTWLRNTFLRNSHYTCRLRSKNQCLPYPSTNLTDLSAECQRQRRVRIGCARLFSALTTVDKDISTGLLRLLDEKERHLLEEQRSLTARSRELAQQVGISIRDFSSNAILEDYSTFAIVIAGEYNAGKSTLINALIGQKLLEAGALPTTDCITIISHTDPPSLYPQVQHYTVDLPLLQDLTLVDTPGTNAVVTDHTAQTLRLLPSADMILFVTSADRPFPESERSLLESIASYRKSISIVVNKLDILEQEGGAHGNAEKQKVLDFVTEHASDLLGARPVVIGVSSRDALAAKLTRKQDLNLSTSWNRSNFAELESFLRESLTTETKIKAKLSSPIGVAEGLLTQCVDHLRHEQSELESDRATLNLLDSQFSAWKKELASDMERASNEMTTLLQQYGERCDLLLRRTSLSEFYSWCLFDTMSLMREWDKTRPSFSHKQIQEQLLDMVAETASSIATRGRAQGQAVIEFLGKRPSSKNQSLVGSVTAASRFEDTRQSLSENMTKAVERHVDIDDLVEERRVLRSLKQIALFSSALNFGALGSAMLAATQFIDVITGLVSCSAFVMSSAATVTSGRWRVAQQQIALWSSRRASLAEALQAICDKEIERVSRRVQEGVAPYTRFVAAEQERIESLSCQCEDELSSAQRLRNRINKLR